MVSSIDWVKHNEIIMGHGWGYTGSSINLREAVVALGVKLSKQSKIKVFLCHPLDFHPIGGSKNILLTMTEGYPVPKCFPEAFKKADLVLTPSKFCYDLFKPICKAPLAISKLGFDEKFFSFRERQWQYGEEFLWLYVGAPNSRKGWDKLMSAFAWVLRELPWIRVMYKVSTEGGDGKIIEKDGIIFDSRPYKRQQLADLYGIAHAFCLPTACEGVGLSLLESIATGLPVVTTKYSGQLDFLNNDRAFFCKHSMGKIDMAFAQKDIEDGKMMYAAHVDVPDLARTMLTVIEDYPAALEKARRGSEFVHKNFTWTHAARQLIKNIDRMGWNG